MDKPEVPNPIQNEPLPDATFEHGSLARNAAKRVGWKWYHYYFVLALVDLLVIGASFLLIQRTTNSYEIALQKLSSTHARQRWIAGLRLLVMNMNAPGNDVFESYRIAEEKTRFQQARAALSLELKCNRAFEFDLSEFQAHLNKMIEDEERIFELLEKQSQYNSEGNPAGLLEEATRSMAAMDRHQTQAITALTEIEQGFLMRVESLLREHGSRIQWHADLERAFVGLIVLILAGMFWYGRKLQRLHEEMTLQHQWALDERLARLAAVGEVCAAVAHGIRNPLASISSSAQLSLSGDGCSDAARSRMQDILSECRRLDDRVTHLLSFASSTSNTGQTFNLKEVAEQALAELAPQFRDRGMDVTLSFSTNPIIQGDRERMVQCLIELISNSLEYSPRNGKVTVRCDSSSDRRNFVDLVVADEGPGIPPNLAEKVFDLFFTTRPGGTGVGLASVKHTIHSMGGEVSVASKVGSGGCIRVTLPVQV